jgi:hypothetical protein
MQDFLKRTARALFGSKKFLALLTTLIVLALTRKLGLDEPTATELGREIVAVASAYMVGQGVADHGKERARHQAETFATLRRDAKQEATQP